MGVLLVVNHPLNQSQAGYCYSLQRQLVCILLLKLLVSIKLSCRDLDTDWARPFDALHIFTSYVYRFVFILFSAHLSLHTKYADPVADFIDKWNAFRYRLFRESYVYHRGNYVKDLSHLGRPINQIVILDNSPASYMFHTHHVQPVQQASARKSQSPTRTLLVMTYWDTSDIKLEPQRSEHSDLVSVSL
ncbi:hypothetical protein PHET_10327 [Paragonimus heterotremus]|uniref:Mitochondrial import inner membrane translocase subunit TIM50 n=1 Tax=Paragonimus heterotremus TaxID=100268 RepID=A0A8J4SZ39_9TREM|nr:hypothetical protein PHET_10327 [Paragonimus heterotremus]